MAKTIIIGDGAITSGASASVESMNGEDIIGENIGGENTTTSTTLTNSPGNGPAAAAAGPTRRERIVIPQSAFPVCALPISHAI
jgi:hypothetical protein